MAGFDGVCTQWYSVSGHLSSWRSFLCGNARTPAKRSAPSSWNCFVRTFATCQMMECYTIVNFLLVTLFVLLITEVAAKKDTYARHWTIFQFALSIANFLLTLWLAARLNCSSRSRCPAVKPNRALPAPDEKQIEPVRAKALDFAGSNTVTLVLAHLRTSRR